MKRLFLATVAVAMVALSGVSFAAEKPFQIMASSAFACPISMRC